MARKEVSQASAWCAILGLLCIFGMIISAGYFINLAGWFAIGVIIFGILSFIL